MWHSRFIRTVPLLNYRHCTKIMADTLFPLPPTTFPGNIFRKTLTKILQSFNTRGISVQSQLCILIFKNEYLLAVFNKFIENSTLICFTFIFENGVPNVRQYIIVSLEYTVYYVDWYYVSIPFNPDLKWNETKNGIQLHKSNWSHLLAINKRSRLLLR